MTSYIMSSGKIPNGTYLFTFELWSASSENTCGGNKIATIRRDVEIYEPTFLDLQSPGFNSIAEADQSPVFTTYPNLYGVLICVLHVIMVLDYQNMTP